MSPATWQNPIGYCETPRSNIYRRRNCSWLNVVLIQISTLKATRVNEITHESPPLVQIAWSWGNPCGEVDLKQYAGLGWFNARLWRSSGIFPATVSQSLRVSSTYSRELDVRRVWLSFRKTDRHQKAGECYRRSLKINPFLWSSFEALCRLGQFERRIFPMMNSSRRRTRRYKYLLFISDQIQSSTSRYNA